MLKNFFAKPKKPALGPAGKRIYAIGDIHGCAAELDAIMAIINGESEFSDAALPSQIIFLGDYVDRGPDSKGVIDRLIAVSKLSPDTVFLKGNHEAAMLDFLSDPEDMAQWLDWGGDETIKSYGAPANPDDDKKAIAAGFLDALPEDHIRFFKALKLHHTEGDYLFVHAGIRPGRALDEQTEDDLLWIRQRFHNANVRERPQKTVVHGHHPVVKPVDAGWRIGVDTGACFSGKLSAVVIEGRERRFITASA